MWTIDQQIEETQFHIEGMRSLILALSYEPPRMDQTLMRTLAFSLQAMRERRDGLRRQRDGVDQ